MKRGLEMAVSDLNAAGGVLGQKIQGIVEDDACDPKKAVAAANKVASSGVKLVAGHFCSGSSIPASAVYAEERSEEHTSELQSLMRISYAVFGMKKKKINKPPH